MILNGVLTEFSRKSNEISSKTKTLEKEVQKDIETVKELINNHSNLKYEELESVEKAQLDGLLSELELSIKKTDNNSLKVNGEIFSLEHEVLIALTGYENSVTYSEQVNYSLKVAFLNSS